ncbi:hypothetical protein SBRCBS47491_010125 [Sporothrix bragantina]|uniref:G-protein coupled receptors family 2 profile 2 domain-containing protein n=1 Tax=Sporothrix bragantina TaxID=671064 RepID=A0ABP0D037_9PEZI
MNDDLATMQLSSQQASVVVGLERAGASLSMIGVLLIIITFGLFKRLRTVPNTFILFASMANIGASTASLIGLSGIAQGSDSALCRAQAFLLEMFMQSDPWWSFAMAFNVYLVFFHSANPTTFRRHLWMYCLVCFGLPMIPAIVCLYVQSASKGPIYGDATLWCWIGDSWNALRIYSYYIPIWVCIFFSAVIYVAVGYHVFHQRNQLRNLTLSNQAKDLSSSENLNPPIYGTVTTEVQITSDVCETALSSERTPPTTPLGSPMHCPWSEDPFPLDNQNHNHRMDEEMGGGPMSVPPAVHGIHSSGPSTTVYQATSTTVITSPSPPHGFAPVARGHHHLHGMHHHNSIHSDPLSSTYRLQPEFSLTHGGNYHSHHLHRSTTSGKRSRRPRVSVAERFRGAWHRFTGKLRHMDPVKLAYLRTSFVFAISVLVTWTPSSINRVYALVYPSRISYGLNIASAAVLPLQGVWNAVIYFSTSWNLLRDETVRACARSRWLQKFHHKRNEIPGIVVDDRAADRERGMAVVLSPARTHSGSRGHEDVLGIGAGDDTESDGLDGLDSFESGSPGLRSGNNRRLRPAASMDLNACSRNGPRSPRSPPRHGTLRVQRGGQLDT